MAWLVDASFLCNTCKSWCEDLRGFVRRFAAHCGISGIEHECFVSLRLNVISSSVSRWKIFNSVSGTGSCFQSLMPCASQCPRVDTHLCSHLNMHPHFCAVHVCIKTYTPKFSSSQAYYRKISSHPAPRAIVNLIYNIKTRPFMGNVFELCMTSLFHVYLIV